MKNSLSLFIFFICVSTLSFAQKSRLIVTTDLGGTDPDDIQSMMHLLVCSNTVDIEGIISQQAWMNDADKTHYVRKVVDDFCEVLPCLTRHAQGYPTAGYLRSIIAKGQLLPHMDGVGEGKDSEGSRLILQVVDRKEDERPVWLTAWGGMNTIAQAIWRAHQDKSEKEFRQFVKKIRIYDILGQDDAGAWIAKNFPEIIYLRNTKVYGWAPTNEWIAHNIQNINPYGKKYPSAKWAVEGDSPAFLYLLENGLNNPEYIEQGGWGGRFERNKQANIRGMSFVKQSGHDENKYDDYYMHGSAPEGVVAINQWQQHIWNDFMARMQWTATHDYSQANHHPIAAIGRDKSKRIIEKSIKAGKTISLDASASFDPDGHSLQYSWFQYKEAGSFEGVCFIEQTHKSKCMVRIPREAKGKTIHIVLQITDNGVPALTAYRRLILFAK